MKLYLVEVEKKEKDELGKEVLNTYFYSFLCSDPDVAWQDAEAFYGKTIKNVAEIPK